MSLSPALFGGQLCTCLGPSSQFSQVLTEELAPSLPLLVPAPPTGLRSCRVRPPPRPASVQGACVILVGSQPSRWV